MNTLWSKIGVLLTVFQHVMGCQQFGWSPLCGTDGSTYFNICQFKKIQINFNNLEILYYGTCNYKKIARTCKRGIFISSENVNHIGNNIENNFNARGIYINSKHLQHVGDNVVNNYRISRLCPPIWYYKRGIDISSSNYNHVGNNIENSYLNTANANQMNIQNHYKTRAIAISSPSYNHNGDNVANSYSGTQGANQMKMENTGIDISSPNYNQKGNNIENSYHGMVGPNQMYIENNHNKRRGLSVSNLDYDKNVHYLVGYPMSGAKRGATVNSKVYQHQGDNVDTNIYQNGYYHNFPVYYNSQNQFNKRNIKIDLNRNPNFNLDKRYNRGIKISGPNYNHAGNNIQNVYQRGIQIDNKHRRQYTNCVCCG